MWDGACPYQWTGTESGSAGPSRATCGHLFVELTRHVGLCWESNWSMSCVGSRPIDGITSLSIRFNFEQMSGLQFI